MLAHFVAWIFVGGNPDKIEIYVDWFSREATQKNIWWPGNYDGGGGKGSNMEEKRTLFTNTEIFELFLTPPKHLFNLIFYQKNTNKKVSAAVKLEGGGGKTYWQSQG